jgi:hypothetical protein
MPAGAAAVMSIASRLWTVAAELLGGTAAALLVRGRPAAANAEGMGIEDVPVPQQP